MDNKAFQWANPTVADVAERVRSYLTEKRYLHTLAVAREAARLSAIYLPTETARLEIAALLHDITKKADFKKQLQYCEEFGIICSNGFVSAEVLHGHTAAALAARDFADVTDEEILSGIRWHTTGRAGMTMFESIIYLADYIEETRTHASCCALRQMFYSRIDAGEDAILVLRDAMIASYDATLRYLLDSGVPIETDTIAARNFFIAQNQNRQEARG